jgi:hypothetical protein
MTETEKREQDFEGEIKVEGNRWSDLGENEFLCLAPMPNLQSSCPLPTFLLPCHFANLLVTLPTFLSLCQPSCHLANHLVTLITLLSHC